MRPHTEGNQLVRAGQAVVQAGDVIYSLADAFGPTLTRSGGLFFEFLPSDVRISGQSGRLSNFGTQGDRSATRRATGSAARNTLCRCAAAQARKSAFAGSSPPSCGVASAAARAAGQHSEYQPAVVAVSRASTARRRARPSGSPAVVSATARTMSDFAAW